MYRPSRANHNSNTNKRTSDTIQTHFPQRRNNIGGPGGTKVNKCPFKCRSFKMYVMFVSTSLFLIYYVNVIWSQAHPSVKGEKAEELNLRKKDSTSISNANTKDLKVTKVMEVDDDDGEDDDTKQSTAVFQKNHQECSFRTYKPHRYYPIQDLSEPFLADSEYIRGKLPSMLRNHREIQDTTSSTPHKLCINTSSWENLIPGRRPFSDGQNPSFVSLDKPGIDLPIKELYGKDVKDKFIGLLLFGDSQCRWNMAADELEEYNFSPLQSAPSKRTMVLVLDHDLQPIGEAVLELELDADWGEKKKKYKYKRQQNPDGSFKRIIVEMDDARLFFHNDQLHVLYRNGPSYGYDKQIQNIIHVELIGNRQFKAFIKATETFTVCCGRNMAFISELPRSSVNDGSSSTSNDLYALTWIDPVTTQVVNVPQPKSDTRRLSEELMSLNLDTLQPHRRLASKKKSSIHGTNGYMVPLHSSSELLGIAHFHRPENRDTSNYARHGHHYTHAFFTIKESVRKDNESEVQFHLSRLSNEFVFPSPSSLNKDTADVIQFASGLDFIGSEDDSGKLMISYGINDCEAVIVFVDFDLVDELLLPVNEGEEVVDVMKKLDI